MAVKARSIGHFPVDVLHQVHQKGGKNMLIVSVFVERVERVERALLGIAEPSKFGKSRQLWRHSGRRWKEMLIMTLSVIDILVSVEPTF